MLASISPLGERARGNRWALTAAAYTAGSLSAATVAGAVLGALGAVPPLSTATRWGLLAAVATGAALMDATGRVPSAHRQVDEEWLTRFRGWVYGVGFGSQLGLGVVTVVTTATVYAWMLGTVATGRMSSGAVAGAAFGLARSAPLLLVARDRTPAALRASLRRLARSATSARLAAAGASSLIAVLAVVRS